MAERVWDKFLTPEDKATTGNRPHLAYGFGERPALILIDLYRCVFGERSQPLAEAMKEWPMSCGPAAWNALPHIQKLLATAREAGLPIIHVRQKDPDTVGIDNWSEQGLTYTPRAKAPEFASKRAGRYDIIPQVAPRPGEALIEKSGPSAFWGTPLLMHLTALRIDTLIVAGESTSGCVRAAVVDGRTNRYKMVVAEECVFDRHEACHAINLFDMHQKYADVLALAEILEHLKSQVLVKA
jgi:maleamate amidohydrolase